MNQDICNLFAGEHERESLVMFHTDRSNRTLHTISVDRQIPNKLQTLLKNKKKKKKEENFNTPF